MQDFYLSIFNVVLLTLLLSKEAKYFLHHCTALETHFLKTKSKHKDELIATSVELCEDLISCTVTIKEKEETLWRHMKEGDYSPTC